MKKKLQNQRIIGKKDKRELREKSKRKQFKKEKKRELINILKIELQS